MIKTEEELEKEYKYVFGDVSEKEKEELLETVKKEFIDLYRQKYDTLCSSYRQSSNSRPIPAHFKSMAMLDAYNELWYKYYNISPKNGGWIYSKIWGLNANFYDELSKFIQ